MISTFLLALILLAMCFASFIVGVAITYKAFTEMVNDIDHRYSEMTYGAKWEALKKKLKK